jgi:hypothetical protein
LHFHGVEIVRKGAKSQSKDEEIFPPKATEAAEFRQKAF